MNINDLNTSTLVDGCGKLNIALNDDQIGQFLLFYEMLTEKNKVMNLTAITEWEDVVVRHFLDSLLLCRAADLTARPLRMMDLGTGAGFPGIPLKIAFPDLEITLADSLNKRILFLNDVIRELGLKKVETVHARAEELGRRKEYRETYDLVVSRAVANLSSLCEYCIPFVKPGGKFISYKSTNIDMEYEGCKKAAEILGGSCRGVTVLPLPASDMERSFVTIEKLRKTPARYPRKAGTPSKEPLS